LQVLFWVAGYAGDLRFRATNWGTGA